MADVIPLFSNYTLTGTTADSGRLVSFTQDWVAFMVQVSSVSAGASAQFRCQWSNDGGTWFDATPQDVIGTATVAGALVGWFPVSAPYWRLGAVVTGASPAIVCSAYGIV